MKNTHILALAIILSGSLWIYSGRLSHKEEAHPVSPEAESAPSAPESPKVQIEPMTAEEKSPEITINGVTEADRKVDLIAESDGRVEKIMVRDGQIVKAGDIIMKLDQRDRVSRLEEAKAKLKSEQLQLKASKVLAEKGFKSDIGLALDKASTEQAEAALISARNDLDKTIVRAPFGGKVDKISIKEGDYAGIRFGGGGGFGTPALGVLLDLDPINITGFVAEKDRSLIEVGQSATIKLSDNSELSGKVKFIATSASSETRSYRIDIQVSNPNNQLLDGQSVELHLKGKSIKSYFISPSSLSLDDKGIVGVKTVNQDNLVQFTPVTIIADNRDGIWVTGLPDSINLITNGQALVAAGQAVNTATPTTP